MSAPNRLERLAESLLEVERNHPGIPEDRRERLSERLAASIGRRASSVPRLTVLSEGPDTGPELEGLPPPSMPSAAGVGGAFFHRVPGRWLGAMIRTAAASAMLTAPWALAAGLGAAAIAGAGAWAIYRSTHRAAVRAPAVAPSVQSAGSGSPPAPIPQLPPLPEPPGMESSATSATKPRTLPRPAPPVAPLPEHSPIPPARSEYSTPRSSGLAPPHRPAPTGAMGPDESLLESARAALNTGEAASALEKLQEHRIRFPGSQFLEEREILTMEAELFTGRTGAARVSAESFLARHPESLLVPRAKAILHSLAVNPSATSPGGSR